MKAYEGRSSRTISGNTGSLPVKGVIFSQFQSWKACVQHRTSNSRGGSGHVTIRLKDRVSSCRCTASGRSLERVWSRRSKRAWGFFGLRELPNHLAPTLIKALRKIWESGNPVHRPSPPPLCQTACELGLRLQTALRFKISLICVAAHVPPRAVGIPRALRAAAVFRMDAPVA